MPDVSRNGYVCQIIQHQCRTQVYRAIALLLTVHSFRLALNDWWCSRAPVDGAVVAAAAATARVAV